MSRVLTQGRETVRVVSRLRAGFTNWPVLTARVIVQRLWGGRGDIVAQTRSGVTVRCPNHPDARQPLLEVFADEAYLDAVRDRRSRTIIDIGAHVGCFTLMAAMECPEATIYCVEASPSTYAYLRVNVRLNGLLDRVHTYNSVCAAREGIRTFWELGAGIGQNSTLRVGGRALEVEAISLSRLVSEATEQGHRVDLVKMDCEGSEYDIVLGSDTGTLSLIDAAILEYHPHPSYDFSDIASRLRDAGLQLRRARAGGVPGHGLALFSRDV